MYELPGLTTQWLGRCLKHFEEVDSTSNYCKEHASELPDGAAVMADFQTGGKGRMGKSWSNPKGHTLSLSFLLRRPVKTTDMMVLPLVAGLGIARGLEALCGGERFSIKWSNDVLCDQKKICGILCESRISPSGVREFAVVGFGVNLIQTQQDFERLGLVYANSLQLATQKIFTPAQVAAATLNALEPLLDSWRSEGFAPLLPLYREKCITLGRQVRIIQDGKEQEAFAQDIGEDGSLLCTTPGGETLSVIAGETSVRGLYGYV